MLVNCDVKSLEVFVVADLSGDKIMREECADRGHDMHQANQDAFNLPDRGTAKRFMFKLIYGATAYGYATDTDFISISTKEDFWQGVIDRFYSKYHGVYAWHKRITQEAQSKGFLTIPSGRYFPFSPSVYNGRVKWPITQIKNYPVQGFGADLVQLARIEAADQFEARDLDALLVSTVHDSLVADTPDEHTEEVCDILTKSVAKVPELCYNIYDYKFSLPMFSEVLIGPNKKHMKGVK